MCAIQRCITSQEKEDLFVCVREDPACNFFFNNARDNMSFDEMAMMMVEEYNSNARQLRVRKKLVMLRLDRYMAEHSLTTQDESLTKLVELIDRRTPQCQQQHWFYASKTNFSRRTVLCFSRLFIPIGSIITGRYTFDGSVAALREPLQLANVVLTATSDAQHRMRNSFDRTYHQKYGRSLITVRNLTTLQMV